jgi:hypothetical protein
MAEESRKEKKEKPEHLNREELERLVGGALPNRENMSLLSLGGSGVLGGLADPLDPGAAPDAGGGLPTEGVTDEGSTESDPASPLLGTATGLADLAAEEASSDADGSSTIGEDGTISSHDTASSET